MVGEGRESRRTREEGERLAARLPLLPQCVTMGCEGRYVAEFLRYLSDFVANIRPDDPLPVRAPNYKVTESEIDGQILDIVHHYLNSR
ncbi:hypothetical protein E2C01_080128 [Portunus trituberculatus]|uniref:Uncharacterized protein n=1 Tax=Portunus trituberculatus TaxID=210409 RepID=A0A5B7IXK5_PORTR|nr:hypothetical protein [Portunus trituberculatus]